MAATALGMIETIGLVSAIEAADAGLKAADVRLLGTDYVRGGLVMIRFEGEVAAVKAAVDAGTMAAQRVGKVFSSHVIPRAVPEVFCMLASDTSIGPGKRAQGGCASCGGCEGGRLENKPAQSLQRDVESTVEAEEGAGTTSEEQASFGMEELQGWKVVRLRSYVRGLKGFPLTPNDIRYATKQALLDAITAYLPKEE